MAEATCDYCGYPLDDHPTVTLGTGDGAWLVHATCELEASLLFDVEDAATPSTTDAAPTGEAIETACTELTAWLRDLPSWPEPASDVPAASFGRPGPTILSHGDLVLHLARQLEAAGVPGEDQHVGFVPGGWMFTGGPEAPPIDLAVIGRERLLATRFPVAPGTFRLDAVIEITSADAVAAGVDRAAAHVRWGLTDLAYVIAIEEHDRPGASDLSERAAAGGVRLRLLSPWR